MMDQPSDEELKLIEQEWGSGIHDLSTLNLTFEQKYWLAYRYSHKIESLESLVFRFKLHERTIRKYTYRIGNGDFISSANGRPNFVTKEIEEMVFNYLNSEIYKKTPEMFEEFVTKAIQNDCISKGRLLPSDFKPSKRTLKRLKRKLDISIAKGEVITSARYKAMADIRNAVSFAAMNHYMINRVPVHLILNSDATQYSVGDEYNQKCEVLYSGTRNQMIKVAPEGGKKPGLCYYIKYYLLISAGGWAGPPVYIIADNSMPEGLINVYEAPDCEYQIVWINRRI